MSKKKSMMTLMGEHKTLFIIISVVLFLVELEIFAVAAMKSGHKSLLQVLDDNGNVIHETDGQNLSDFNKYYFEKMFGPFEQYHVKLITKDRPFPFRAWFVAAVGVPVGAVLLFAFFIRAYQSLFYGSEKSPYDPDLKNEKYEYRFEKIVTVISRFNIFTIGFLIFLGVFSYWVIPDLIVYIGKLGTEALSRYKWVFLAAAVIFLALIIWIIYLRYLLAKKTIERQTEIDKYRLKLEYDRTENIPPRLKYDDKETSYNVP